MDNVTIINIIFSVILPVLITSGVSLWLGRAQSKRVKVDIAEKYQMMLEKEIEARKELSDRVDELARENLLLRHAFSRAVRFIKENVRDQKVPDFMEDSHREIK